MNAIPTVTKNLLIINVLVFLATIVAQSYHLDLARYLGLHFFLADDFNVAQLITYMFMHGGFTHLFFNMFAVWMLFIMNSTHGTGTLLPRARYLAESDADGISVQPGRNP